MPRNTLDSMIRLLGKAEIAEVSAFLACPSQGAKPEHIACFKLLSQPSRKEVPDDALFTHAFGDEPFDDAKLRRLKSETCRLLEDYLVQQELKNAAHLRSELLVGALGRRKDYHLFKETIHKRLRRLEAGPAQGKAFFREAAFLYQSLYHHPKNEGLDKDSDLLQRHINHAERHFTIACLENASEILIRKRTVATKERLLFLDSALQAAESGAGESPVVDAFHSLYRLLNEEGSASDFLPLKNKVLDCLKNMDDPEKRMALKLLTAKAYSLTKAGSSEQIPLIFELYKKSVEAGLSVAANGIIDPNHFSNTVIAGAKAGEFDWVHKFLQQYKRHLPATEKETVERFCLGSIYFQQGMKTGEIADYRRALQYLDLVPQRIHEKYNLRIRSLSIRIQFELFRADGDLELVDRQVKNFEAYLKKNSNLSNTKKEEYRSFLSSFRALCRLQNNPDTTLAMVDKYLKELVGESKIFLWDWLCQKAEERRSSLRR